MFPCPKSLRLRLRLGAKHYRLRTEKKHLSNFKFCQHKTNNNTMRKLLWKSQPGISPSYGLCALQTSPLSPKLVQSLPIVFHATLARSQHVLHLEVEAKGQARMTLRRFLSAPFCWVYLLQHPFATQPLWTILGGQQASSEQFFQHTCIGISVPTALPIVGRRRAQTLWARALIPR